jgi:hypothetical protein
MECPLLEAKQTQSGRRMVPRDLRIMVVPPEQDLALPPFSVEAAWETLDEEQIREPGRMLFRPSARLELASSLGPPKLQICQQTRSV